MRIFFTPFSSNRTRGFHLYARGSTPLLFFLLKDLFHDTAEFTLCYGLYDCSPCFHRYFTFSLSTLASRLASQLTGDYWGGTTLIKKRSEIHFSKEFPILNFIDSLKLILGFSNHQYLWH